MPLMFPPAAIQAPPGDGPLADLARARALAASGKPGAAADLLSPWIARGDRDAVIAGATYLAWAGRARRALALLDPWIRGHGEDREARLLRARVLGWQGRWTDAERAYGALAADPASDPGSVDEARIGLARLALWREDPDRAQQELRRVSPGSASAPGARLVAAQVEAAEGHPAAARRAATDLALRPDSAADAAPVLQGLDDRLGPWAEAGFSRTETSEGLRILAPGLRARLPLGDGALDLGWTGQEVSLGPLTARPAIAELGFTQPWGARWAVSAGLARVREVDGGTTGFRLHAAFLAAPGLRIGYGHSRDFAVSTPAAVALGTAFTTDALDLAWRWTGRQGVSLFAERTTLSAGSTRTGYRAAYRFEVPHGPLQAWWGLSSRGFGYSETLPLGFFNPRRYRWHGLMGGAAWNREGRFQVTLQAEGGVQTLDGGPGTFSWEYGLRGAWTPGGGRMTLSAAWTQSRAGLPVVASGDPAAYREHGFTFSLRLRGGHGTLTP